MDPPHPDMKFADYSLLATDSVQSQVSLSMTVKVSLCITALQTSSMATRLNAFKPQQNVLARKKNLPHWSRLARVSCKCQQEVRGLRVLRVRSQAASVNVPLVSHHMREWSAT